MIEEYNKVISDQCENTFSTRIVLKSTWRMQEYQHSTCMLKKLDEFFAIWLLGFKQEGNVSS